MCPDSLSRDRYFEGLKKGTETPTTETTTLFNYPGWAELVAGLEPKTPEMALNDASIELASRWDDLLKPHSPLSPEGAAKAGFDFEIGTNIAYGALTAIVTAIEAAGFGQLETPAMMLPNAPVVRASTEAAIALRMAYLDASLVKGVGYYAAALHQPTIIREQVLIDAFNMGFIDEATFKGQMMYHGYTPERSTVISATGIRMPDIGTILELRRRGVLSDTGMIDWMVLNKIPKATAEAVANLVVQYPEPYRLAEMYSKGIIGSTTYWETMHNFGFSLGWAEAWGEAQLNYPDFSTAMALLRRGEIDESTFYFWMQHSQISPLETEAMLKLKDVIPPIQDLIRFAVREAYLDHDPEKQYPAMVDIAKKMGLTAEASQWYWYAHWDRIPVNLMFANYHRGLWNVDKLARMLKIVDIHPDDRQDIINVAYGPPNVRELGYGWDVGVYTEEDVEKYRRMGGLSPEDAKKAAVSLVAYRTEGERNSVRTELMYAYGMERIEEDVLRSELEALNTPTAAIELWVERAELYRERLKKPSMDVEGRIVSSSEALTAFKLGIRDEAWTRQALKDLDWAADRIEVAIEKAKVDIEKQKEVPVTPKYRMLTVAQIRQFYSLQLLSKEQMETELVIIGYSPDDAAVLTEVFTVEPEVTPQPKAFSSAIAANLYKLMMYDEDDLYNNFLLEGYDDGQSALLVMYTRLIQELPDLQAMYIKGVISGEDVVTELMKMEVPEYNARLLVKKITDQYIIDRLTTEKDLTKAEIIKGVKNQVLTPTQGADLLVDLGYDENEAFYILAINKVVAAGDPEGYWEMRKVTESYKRAKGEKYVEIPDEAIMLEKQIKQVKSQIDELKKTSGNEDAIAELLLKLNTLELAMKTLVTEKKLK
jgi:hypothetical protein